MALYENTERVNLIKIPGKEALHAANAFDGLYVALVTDDQRTYFTKIISLTHEDGSGNSFCFTGRATGPVPINHQLLSEFNVDGYCNTRTNRGHINITYMTADDKPSR